MFSVNFLVWSDRPSRQTPGGLKSQDVKEKDNSEDKKGVGIRRSFQIIDRAMCFSMQCSGLSAVPNTTYDLSFMFAYNPFVCLAGLDPLASPIRLQYMPTFLLRSRQKPQCYTLDNHLLYIHST